jgi:hypothetical protein
LDGVIGSFKLTLTLRKHGASEYRSTLAAWTHNIIFVNMLKFPSRIKSKNEIFVKENE